MSIKSNVSGEKLDNSFLPPNLPIGWIASTFIGPTLVVVLPKLFSSEGSSFAASLIVALVLLSVSLLVICFTLILRLYNESYARQVFEFRLGRAEGDMEKILAHISKLEHTSLEPLTQGQYSEANTE